MGFYCEEGSNAGFDARALNVSPARGNLASGLCFMFLLSTATGQHKPRPHPCGTCHPDKLISIMSAFPENPHWGVKRVLWVCGAVYAIVVSLIRADTKMLWDFDHPMKSTACLVT